MCSCVLVFFVFLCSCSGKETVIEWPIWNETEKIELLYLFDDLYKAVSCSERQELIESNKTLQAFGRRYDLPKGYLFDIFSLTEKFKSQSIEKRLYSAVVNVWETVASPGVIKDIIEEVVSCYPKEYFGGNSSISINFNSRRSSSRRSSSSSGSSSSDDDDDDDDEDEDDDDDEYKEAKSRFTTNDKEAELLVALSNSEVFAPDSKLLGPAWRSSLEYCESRLNVIRDMSDGGAILFTEMSFSRISCSHQTDSNTYRCKCVYLYEKEKGTPYFFKSGS